MVIRHRVVDMVISSDFCYYVDLSIANAIRKQCKVGTEGWAWSSVRLG